MKYIYEKRIKVDITRQFLAAAEEYHNGEIATLAAASKKLDVTPTWFSVNYNNWVKKNNLKSKNAPRWIDNNGDLSDWAKEIYREYYTNQNISVTELMRKYNTNSTSFWLYREDYDNYVGSRNEE